MIFLAGILFCLVMITTALMPGLFARYSATGEGEDNARVARFHVEGTGGAVTVARETRENGEYKLTVTNHSEVAVAYDVDFVFTQPVGNWLNLMLGDTVAAEESPLRFRFADVGKLAPGASGEHTIDFQVDSWDNSLTAAMTGLQGKQELAFTVEIHAVQID